MMSETSFVELQQLPHVTPSSTVEPRSVSRLDVKKSSGLEKPLSKNSVANRPARKRSSAKGDALFAVYLCCFAAAIVASAKGYVPLQSWEVYSQDYHAGWMAWMNDNTWIPAAFGVAYLVLTFSVRWFLAERKGYSSELRLPLAFWSVLLAAFSVLGAMRTVPVVISIIQQGGIHHMVCGDTRSEWVLDNPTAFWTLLFCLSKIPELGDTAFIVLRKKPLITLHWYHHVTVMLFCWHALATMSLNGIIFAAMNLTIHGIMYAFYALAAVGLRPSSFAVFLTLGQIAQMVVGTVVTGYVVMDKLYWNPVTELSYEFKFPPWVNAYESQAGGGPCLMSDRAAFSGFLMYLSYLYFFVEFFFKVYLGGGREQSE